MPWFGGVRQAEAYPSAMPSLVAANLEAVKANHPDRLIAQGLPGKHIAGTLGISERTVKFHTAALIRKLGADNRAQAVAVAAQRGLLE